MPPDPRPRPPGRRRGGLWRIVAFAVFIAAATAAAIFANAWLDSRPIGARFLDLVATMAASAGLAALMAWPLANRVAGGRPGPARFSALAILLALGTIGIGGAVFVALRFPLVDFGDSPFLFSDLVMSSAASLFLYAGTGPRTLLPCGVFVLFGGAIAFARRRR